MATVKLDSNGNKDQLECSTCLAKDVSELISIYCRFEPRDKVVAEMLSEVVQREYPHQTTDKYPQYICDQCLVRLDVAYSLLQKVHHSDQILKQSVMEGAESGPDLGEGNCRICQRDDVDEFISVFCVYGDNRDKLIADLLAEACAVSRPDPSDNLPQNICGDCFELLSMVYEFRMSILALGLTMNGKDEIEENQNPEPTYWNQSKSILPPPLEKKFVPLKDEDRDPFIYLDSAGVDANRLMPLFFTTEDNQYYEQLMFFGVICCCGKLLVDNDEWQEHRRVVHSTKKLSQTTKNKCEICYLKFQYAQQLTDHLEHRDKKQFYRCKICNVLTKDMRNLQQHFEFTRFHPYLADSEAEQAYFDANCRTDYEPLGTCCDCYEEFETGEALMEHTQQRHYPEQDVCPTFQCMTCYNSFADKQSLLKHQLAFNGTRTYHCLEPECQFRTTDRIDIKTHLESGTHFNVSMLAVAEPEPEIISEYFCCFYLCGEPFESYEALEQHCITEHIELRTANQTFINGITHNVCPLCLRHFPMDSSFQRHLQTQRTRNHICSTCGKKFFCRENLINHERIHKKSTTTTVFSCDQCDATYVAKYSLEKHIRKIHQGIQPELCTTCGRSFGTKTALKYHIVNMHMQLRPHKCQECPREFGTKASLQKHMIIHSDDRPYKCSSCDIAYKYTSDLKRHEAATHRNEKPFVCELCDASFVRVRELRVHMTRHTKNKFFSCPVSDCGFSTNVRKHMRDHESVHHGEDRS